VSRQKKGGFYEKNLYVKKWDWTEANSSFLQSQTLQYNCS
jgi:hypothetical protein